MIAVCFLLASCNAGPDVVVTTASSAPRPTVMPAATPSPALTPTPTPVPPTPGPDPVREIISQMSDEELVGQMVMIGFTGTQEMDSESLSLLRDYEVGNVFLFGWNAITFDQTRALIDSVNAQNPSDIPLLFGIDLEGGTVIRFKNSQWDPALYSAQKLGEKNDPQLVHDQYFRIGEKIKSIGIHINFAPGSTFRTTRPIHFSARASGCSAAIRRRWRRWSAKR